MTDDPHIVARVCTDKHRYRRRESARMVVDSIVARQGEDARPLSCYRCPFCRGFHVGHVPSMETLERVAAVLRRTPNPAPFR